MLAEGIELLPPAAVVDGCLSAAASAQSLLPLLGFLQRCVDWMALPCDNQSATRCLKTFREVGAACVFRIS